MTNFGIFPRDQRNNEAVSDASDQLKDVEPVISENEAFESFRAGTPNDQERFGDAVKDETEVSKQNLIQKISEKLKNSAQSKKNIARAAIAAVAMAGTVALLANCGRVNDDNNQPGNSVDIEDQDDQIDLDDEFDNNNGGNITVDIDDDGNVTIDHGNTDGGNGEIIDGGVDGDIDVIDDNENENRVNRDDYWEGDTFHLDDYAAALGYKHLEGDSVFSFQFRDAGGNVTSYVQIGIRPNDSSIRYHDNASENEGELSYMYRGDNSGQTANIEFDDEIWTTDDFNSVESRIDAFDHFAYDASDALDWNGLSNWN